MAEFTESLAAGKESEKNVLEFIRNKYPKAHLVDGYFKGFDIYIPEIDKGVEVKRDYKSKYTGNLVVEVFMFDKPSGLLTTEALYWVFVTSEQHIYITPDNIKNCILLKGVKQSEFVGSGDVESKKAYLVKVKDIIEFSDKMIHSDET
jgi:hypothetical protein